MTSAQLIVQIIMETRTQFQAVCTDFFQIMTIYQTLFSILLRHYTTKRFLTSSLRLIQLDRTTAYDPESWSTFSS